MVIYFDRMNISKSLLILSIKQAFGLTIWRGGCWRGLLLLMVAEHRTGRDLLQLISVKHDADPGAKCAAESADNRDYGDDPFEASCVVRVGGQQDGEHDAVSELISKTVRPVNKSC